MTAYEWRQKNPHLAKKDKNIRDFATKNELHVLSNLESANAELICQKISEQKRFILLKNLATKELKILNSADNKKLL